RPPAGCGFLRVLRLAALVHRPSSRLRRRRRRNSKLKWGPSIIPPRADGKGPTTPTILVPQAQPVGEFCPGGGGAKAGFGDRVAQGQDRPRFEGAPPRDPPSPPPQDQYPRHP